MSNLPSRTVNSIPVISGEQFQHVGRYAGAVVLAVFEQIGGIDRMAAWADSSPESFFTKLWPKMIARSQQSEVSVNITIDDAINTLEGNFTEVLDL